MTLKLVVDNTKGGTLKEALLIRLLKRADSIPAWQQTHEDFERQIDWEDQLFAIQRLRA
jgi:hypothetical protein